jgi:hypothetical protein
MTTETEPAADSLDDLLDDLRDELDAHRAVVAADDKAAEAMRLLKSERDAHTATRRLYDAQRVQLAAANKEAARLRKRVTRFEKGELK